MATPVRYGMHEHLRAWRKYRQMTQEQVGDLLGVRHTTVSRWERGLMQLSTSDLTALAALYRARVSQLLAHPGSADLVEKLDRAQAIIDSLDSDELDHWLAIGVALAKGKG